MIVLPWPPRELGPNCRLSHRYTTKHRKAYREAGFYAAQGHKVQADAHLMIRFYPPDNRRRDLDNMLASIKYALDGIATASGVDDYGWSMTIIRCGKVPGGKVEITT